MDPLADASLRSLRRLARALLREPADAEDVVQDAWVALLRTHCPPRPHEQGPWLAGVVRRLAWNRRRESARRHRREALAPAPSPDPGPEATVSGLEVARSLLDAVQSLDEPMRAAVVLRFLEGRPPREIARRQGVPVETARTRVRRGLALLRERLDARHGSDRTSFLEGLAALAAPAWGPEPAALARSAARPWALLPIAAAAATATTLGTLGWMRRAPSSTAGASAPPAALVEAPVEASAPAAERALQEETRRPHAPTSKGSWIVRGIVYGSGFEPAPGVALRGRAWSGTEAAGDPQGEGRFTSDETGAFAWSMDPPESIVHLVVEPTDPGVVGGWGGYVVPRGDPPPDDLMVFAAPLDATVTGTVRGPDGQPIAGALVQYGPEFGSVRSGANGAFRLPVLSDSEIALVASAEGFGTSRSRIDSAGPGETRSVELTLPEEAFLRGRVVDSRGLPVVAASVTSRLSPLAPRTDPDGRFVLGGLARSTTTVDVLVEREGFATAHSRQPLDELPPTGAEIVLHEGTGVAGVVLDAEGDPVESAFVVLHPSWVWTWTDADGRFALEHVAPGDVSLEVSRRGHSPGWAEASIAANLPSPDVILRLAPERVLVGTIRGPGGPVASALVEASATGERWIARPRTLSAQDGAFRLAGLPAGRIDLNVSAHGFALGVAYVDVDQSRADVDLVPNAALAGRVLDDATGAPIPEFVVRVRPALGLLTGETPLLHSPSAWKDGVSVTSPDGSWRLQSGFEAGWVATLEISAPGHAPAFVDRAVSAVDADPDELVARLVSSTRLTGTVVEAESGHPIADALVRIVRPGEIPEMRDEAPRTASGANGSFELVDVPTGVTLLAVSHPAWTEALDGPFEVGAAPIHRTIELDGGARLSGRVLDAAGAPAAGRPVFAASVQARGQTWLGRSTRVETTTDRDGAFVLPAVPRGTYRLGVTLETAGILVEDLVRTLEVSDDVTGLDLRSGGAATVVGRIDSPVTLPPVVPVTLRALVPEETPRADDPRADRGTLAVDGAFRIDGVPPGRYALHASFRGAGEELHRGVVFVEIPQEGTLELVVQVAPAE